MEVMEDGNVVNIAHIRNSIKDEIAEYIKEENLQLVNINMPELRIRRSFYTRFGKRILDILISFFAIILTFPINFLIAIITFFDVGRPILFSQKREGQYRKPFTIYKFRNMTNKVDEKGELLPPEQRVTKWGKIARKTSLDELMNFISVFKGDMSIIGPRPLLLAYSDLFSDFHLHRFDLKPGLECPSINRLDHVMDWKERLDNDVWYTQNCSFHVDLILLMRMVQIAFNKKATAIRGKAAAGRFLGYNRDGSVISSHNVPVEFCYHYCQIHGYPSVEEVFKNIEHQ